jgi:hypothetical protein
MSNQNASPTPREIAIKRCQENIDWYEKAKTRHMFAYQFFQVSALVLSGLTPVLILWTGLPELFKALPAALAAIATGLLGIFQWKDSYIRFGYTSEALKSERVKFETRTTKLYGAELDDHEVLNNFITRIENLVMSETSDWRSQLQKAGEDRNQPSIDERRPVGTNELNHHY